MDDETAHQNNEKPAQAPQAQGEAGTSGQHAQEPAQEVANSHAQNQAHGGIGQQRGSGYQGREQRPQRERPPRAPGDENTIFIGRKSTMGYVLAVVTQFNTGANMVKIKARGKLISMAVDVAEITRGRFLPNAKVDKISITTEEVQNEDGSRSKVSSIEICLLK